MLLIISLFLGTINLCFSNIYLPDSRVIHPTNSHYQPIVQVQGWDFVQAQDNCTGSLVAPNIVLTAAHCIAGAIKTQDYWSGFANRFDLPIYIYKEHHKILVVEARFGKLPINKNIANDWALLKINTDLGKNFGYYFINKDHPEDSFANGDMSSLELPGYSIDHAGRNGRGLSVARSCSIKDFYSSDVFIHDCDLKTGASGAPLLKCVPGQRCMVMGIQSSSIRTPYVRPIRNETYQFFDRRVANIGVSTLKIMAALDQLGNL